MQAALPLMVAGQLVQGLAGYRAGQYNKKVAEVNATTAEREGVAEGDRIRDVARIAMGRQIGAQAESGFEVGTGTAIDSLMESATEAELDIMNARRQAQSRAVAYRTQGAMAAAEGRNKLVGSLFGAAGAVAGAKTDYAQAKAEYGYGS